MFIKKEILASLCPEISVSVSFWTFVDLRMNAMLDSELSNQKRRTPSDEVNQNASKGCAAAAKPISS